MLDLTFAMCETPPMSRKKVAQSEKQTDAPSSNRSVSLKSLAAHVGLSPTTVSFVLNESPLAASIPQATRDRVLAAAEALNYRPNFVARSLRAQRSYTLGILVPELSDGYSAMVLNGIEDYLLSQGFFYFVASHRHKPELIDKYPNTLVDRSVEGLIAVDTPVQHHPSLPVVAVSRHDDVKGVTNIVLNHRRGRNARARASSRAGAPEDRIHEGSGFQLGHGSAVVDDP